MNNATDQPCRNALTVDVEDYFHASLFRDYIAYESWDCMECRVERNTRSVLELLAKFDLRATFFVLGWVARRYPSLVREIQAAGHELGCHSFAHRLVYEQTPEEFRTDTRRALAAIEDAAGVPVRAYRAPSFSITERSLWAIEILLELGFTSDSSIFPFRNFLYGIATAPRRPFRIRTQSGDLMEFTLPTMKIGRWAVPLTGGAYLRLLPYRFQVFGLNGLISRGEPIIFYFHPWELDVDQPRVAAPRHAKLIHYAGLHRTERRLRRLLSRFAFGKLSELASTVTSVYELTPRSALKGHADVFTLWAGK